MLWLKEIFLLNFLITLIRCQANTSSTNNSTTIQNKIRISVSNYGIFINCKPGETTNSTYGLNNFRGYGIEVMRFTYFIYICKEKNKYILNTIKEKNRLF